MRRFAWLLIALAMAAGARGAWMETLAQEPERQKRDDRGFVTLDRLFKAEREAEAADRPYLALYTTLMLERSLGWFRWSEAEARMPDPAAGPCQGWSRAEAQMLLEARAEAALGEAARFAATPAAPFFSATRRDPDAWDSSALAVLWQNVLSDWEPAKREAARRTLLEAARQAGDDALEGTLRLDAIVQETTPREARDVALRELDAARVWPADVRALILKTRAECLPDIWAAQDLAWKLPLGEAGKAAREGLSKQLVARLGLLMDARDLARVHALKATLQQEINGQRQAEVQLLDVPTLVSAGERTTVAVRYRNTQTLSLRVDGGEWETVELPQPEAYVWAQGEVALPALEPGEHTLELRVPQRFTQLREQTMSLTLTASEIAAAQVHEAPFTVFVADIRTGRPLEGAEVSVRGQTQRTDTRGLAAFPDLPQPPRSDATPLTVSWQGKTLKTQVRTPTPHREEAERPCFALFADRALYRPGETVRFEVVCLRHDEEGRPVPDPKASGTLRVMGRPANGKARELAAFPIKPSPSGSFAAEVAIPEDFVGWLYAEEKTWRATEYIGQVAAFKAPTVAVTLRRANVGAPLAEPLRFAGTAFDLSGVPLTGAGVVWEAQNAGETVAGTATVGADGAFAFEVALPKPDRDQFVRVTAAVLDATGERQEGRFTGYLPRHGYEVRIEPAHWALSETPFDVRLTAERAVSGTLAVRRDDATNILARVAFALRETEPGKAEATVPLTLPGGSYTLLAEAGPVTNATGAIVLPRDGDFAVFPKDWSRTGILLRTRQAGEELSVGDTLKGFVAIRGGGPVFLSVTDDDGLRSVLPLDSPFFSLPLTRDLAPAVTLSVYGFEGGIFRATSTRVSLKPPSELKIEAVRVAETARPGSTQRWKLTVDDPDAELVVTCYDKALDALAPYEWATLAARFLRSRWWFGLTESWFRPYWTLSVAEPLPWDFCGRGMGNAIFSLTSDAATGVRGAALPKAARMEANAVADAAVAPEPEAAVAEEAGMAGTQGAAPLPRVRTNFASTALWAPQKRLEGGRAVFSFTLPDTLTTWRLMAFAFAPDGRSGTFTHDCVARQEVMLRPYLPRTLRVGDRLTLNVRLSNTTAKPIATWAELNRAERRAVTLPANGSATVSWEVAAQNVPGTQTFEFATEGDAVRFEVPVRDNRVEVEDIYPITLVDTKPVTVEVQEPTAFRDLFARWDHAPAEAVADALEATLACPYEGCEQLFAKLNASLLLRKLGRAAPNADAREDLWLLRLLAAREGDRWPWFPGGRADACVTAEICVGVARLHLLGLAPKPLEEAVRATLANRENLPLAAWAYARAAFVDVWPADTDLTDALTMAYREAGSVQERRLLALAAQRLGVANVAEQGLKDLLAAANRADDWGLWWPQERLWWRWWHTPLESHALGLELLAAMGRGEDARAAGRWLLQHRRLNDWGSTRATTAAAYALLLTGAPEAKPGPAPALTVASEKAPGLRRVTYARDTPGLSFGSLVARYALPLGQVPPPRVEEDAALTLTRTYNPANPKVGDTVTVRLTIRAAQPMSHLHLRDDRPANTEPVRQLPWWDWQAGAYAQPGDTGLDLFIGDLPRGVTTIEYQLKATHAGQCLPGLATLRSLYAPDFAARTDSTPLTVAP